MPNKPSQKQMLRYGTAIRTAVSQDVASALLKEASRSVRSVGHVAGLVLTAWHELEVEMPERVRDALEAEAARCGMSKPALVRTLLGYWFEDTYLPWRKAQAKKKPA